MDKYQRKVLKAVYEIQCKPRETSLTTRIIINEGDVYKELKANPKHLNRYKRALRECIGLEFLIVCCERPFVGVSITSRGIEALERWKSNLINTLKTVSLSVLSTILTLLLTWLWSRYVPNSQAETALTFLKLYII